MSTTEPQTVEQRSARMRLAEFILESVEPILAEWEAFARSIWPGYATIDPAELRDHAEAILRATVADMGTDQTADEREGKSLGQSSGGEQSRRLDSASDLHGAGRVESGFKLMEVLAEYRALRASVVRLWRASRPDPDRNDLDDLTRFHESIDQSLTRAVRSFTERIDQSRRLFLAILGHDLRNPLNAMMMTGEALSRRQPGVEPESIEMARQIASSATAMGRMIGDLLDFTAAGLGGGMPLSRAPMDLDATCREVVDEMRAAHRDCPLHYARDGDLAGHWDASRLRQVVSNLVGNAVQHGGADCTINVRARAASSGDVVVLEVHNSGAPIPPAALPTIFDPLSRIAAAELPRRHRPGSIGLGLYIAHEVVTSHGGTITATSTPDAGTTFTVRLPRNPQQARRPDAVRPTAIDA